MAFVLFKVLDPRGFVSPDNVDYALGQTFFADSRSVADAIASGFITPVNPQDVQTITFNGTPLPPVGLGPTGPTGPPGPTGPMNPNATGLATTGSPVNVGSAAPPTTGQLLTATSATTATWQTLPSFIRADGTVAFTADQTLAGFKLTNVANPTLAQDASTKNYVDVLDAENVKRNGTVPFTANQSLGSFKLTNVLDPTAAQDAATKNYVDLADAAFIKHNGTVAFTGNQSLGGFKLTSVLDPTAAQDAATKNYVDTADATLIHANGSVAFTADQSLGGFKLTNLANPTVAQDAATKTYVDTATGGATLQSAYNNGAAITLGANGPVALTKSAVDATAGLTVTVTGGTGPAAIFSGAPVVASSVYAPAATALNLGDSATTRWTINTSGHLVAASDNTLDIGASGATRPRTAYLGTSLIAPLVSNDAALSITTTASNGNITLDPHGTGIVALAADVTTTGKVTNYNGVATAGWGLPSIYANGRVTAQSAANASVSSYTVGAADGSFEVQGLVNVTASTTHSFSMTVAYTDEDSVAQTATFVFQKNDGSTTTTITDTTSTGPYYSSMLRIRAKASTSITVATSGTFTSVTYNAEAGIKQVA